MPIGSSPFVFEPSNDVHVRAIARLESEQIAWIGTTGRDGYPHVVPVWFLWHDGRALVLSEPNTVKVRNLRADPRVALHLEAGADHEQLTVLRGTAQLSPRPTADWLDDIGAEYARKYRGGLAGLKLTLPEMAARYSVFIEITPLQLIAW
ncbi:TIGR03618 family F420-dependent PPOX class oxidoreductase [Microbacterium sp.]|jgi:PPOX class probable F420-dependent enzyme|uniref:TIGR03618 family F420-dependent PPOX class oxidoreductase n=1 Tax=Microbacterium sp. TaxID=51671 RepID=UPI0025D131D6|nr:TIGR03618 family F420-dependent PPOX class oxidoreductase [Microbacterium sp.]